MSYCRFSSMNFMCDVYVYEDCYGGWTTHVAGNRCIFPPIPRLPWSWIAKLGTWNHESRRVDYPNRLIKALAWVQLRIWAASDRLHMWSVDIIPRRRIGLQFDGKRFNDATPSLCAETLLMLRAVGYNVPQYAINALQEEAKNEGA